jgi:hypothetical protein
MKPDWKDAPEWANYLAMDKSGDWFWYASRPALLDSEGSWGSPAGHYELCEMTGWKETLESRPE